MIAMALPRVASPRAYRRPQKKNSQGCFFFRSGVVSLCANGGKPLAKQFIIDASEVASGKTRPVTVGEHKLLVCHSGSDFYVVQNQCSHAMARLTGGKLRGHKIFCPLHSAPFDLRDGSPLGAPATEPICAYATTVEDGKVYAVLPD